MDFRSVCGTTATILHTLICCNSVPLGFYQSVDSISRDGPDMPYMQYKTKMLITQNDNAKISNKPQHISMETIRYA